MIEEAVVFFGKYKNISIIVHVFSVIVGMGSALVSDIFFNIFIKDKKIQKYENKILGTLSNIVWVSLLFVVLSGLAIFLSDPSTYSTSAKFLIKMTIVGAIIVNGYLFWHVIHPSLHKLDFVDRNIHHKYVRLRKLSFALGAVSLASWMSAFILGMIGDLPFSYAESLVGYITICFLGILVSQIMENKMTHK